MDEKAMMIWVSSLSPPVFGISLFLKQGLSLNLGDSDSDRLVFSSLQGTAGLCSFSVGVTLK